MLYSSIFNKIRGLLRRRKDDDGDSCLYTPFDEVLFDLENREPDPWYTRAYWAVYRFFKWNNWATPRGAYREIKWFIQRGRRGWADCDTWSLDNYLDRMMPGALHYLKEHKHGVPCGMFEPEDCEQDPNSPNYGQSTKEGFARAEARWEAIMDKMIAGFAAHKRIGDLDYDNELGPYPFGRPAGVSADAWTKVKDERHLALKVLEERDRGIFEEGVALFVRHYNSLWD